MTLTRLRLVSGTWTEALDILREMDITNKEVLEPNGAECDFLPMQLRDGYERISGVDSEQGNEVGRFVNGHLEQNSLNCGHEESFS